MSKSKSKSGRGIAAKVLCAALAVTLTAALTGCGRLAKEDQKKAQADLLIGALVWARSGEFEAPPEDESITLKRVETEEGTRIEVSDPDMLGAYMITEREDGEVESLTFQADDRFASAPGHVDVGDENEIEATLYFDPDADWCVFLYGVYERADGSLYAQRNSAGFSLGSEGGSNSVEETSGDWTARITFHYEPFEASDKMIVSQFDEEGRCLSQTSFAPEEDVELKKAQGYAYAVCQYIKGSQSKFRLAEDDTVSRVIVNPRTGIGEQRNIKLK